MIFIPLMLRFLRTEIHSCTLFLVWHWMIGKLISWLYMMSGIVISIILLMGLFIQMRDTLIFQVPDNFFGLVYWINIAAIVKIQLFFAIEPSIHIESASLMDIDLITLILLVLFFKIIKATNLFNLAIVTFRIRCWNRIGLSWKNVKLVCDWL